MNQVNKIKVVGEPCYFCGTPYIQGKNGAYCQPCWKKWKDAKNAQDGGGTQKSYNQPVGTQNASQGQNIAKNDLYNESIRENVALKMVSELVAAGKIPLSDWEIWTNKFWAYSPKTKRNDDEIPTIDVNQVPF